MTTTTAIRAGFNCVASIRASDNALGAHGFALAGLRAVDDVVARGGATPLRAARDAVFSDESMFAIGDGDEVLTDYDESYHAEHFPMLLAFGKGGDPPASEVRDALLRDLRGVHAKVKPVVDGALEEFRRKLFAADDNGGANPYAALAHRHEAMQGTVSEVMGLCKQMARAEGFLAEFH